MVVFSLVAATDFPHHYPENRHRSSVDFGQRIFLLPAVFGCRRAHRAEISNWRVYTWISAI